MKAGPAYLWQWNAHDDDAPCQSPTRMADLLDELGSFMAASDVKPEEWPWLFNARGMALGGLGRYKEAESEYARMQQLAEQLPEGKAAKHILSTALQNRGSNALGAGDAERASRCSARPGS